MKYLLIVLGIICLTTTGCVPDKIIIKDKYVHTVIVTPEELLTPITVPPPPEMDTYKKLDANGKEKSLMTYINDLWKVISNYENKLSSIQEYQTQQQDLYKDK